ncbi:hypothetical protein XHV734_1066 [Xanthomonas hortorum pv. vitians]|nr:hypothetical protein XHV734_1066 [Xanthomonas hortorum pv. vitians]
MDEPAACAAPLAATIGELLMMNADYAACRGRRIAHSVSLHRNSRTRRIALHTLLKPRSYAHGTGTGHCRQKSAGRNQRRHRDPQGFRAGQVRSGQGQRRDLRRPHPVDPDALSLQLRLRAQHLVWRWRPGRCAGGAAAAAGAWLGGALPSGGRAAHERRSR